MKRFMMFMMIVFVVLTQTADARTYKIGMTPWVGWSPAQAAEVKGFWTEQGIDVKVFSFPDNLAMDAALKNKLVDISFEMLGTAVGMYMDGLPVVILAETDWSHGGDKIIAKQDLDPAQLKGKHIGVYLNQPSVAYFLNQYLASIGLALSDVKIVEMGTTALTDKFIDGVLSVIINYDPDALRAEREGQGKLVATSATYEGCIPEGMIARQDVLAEIPQKDLLKILSGWSKAAEWTHDPANWNEYMTILNTVTFKGSEPFSEQDLREMVAAVRIHDAAAQLERNRDGGGLPIYLTDLKAFLSKNNMLKKDFQVEELMNNKAIVKALTNF